LLRFLRILPVLLAILLLTACGSAPVEEGVLAATTGPVAQFAQAIVEGTDLTVRQVITDSVSCLHDYSLSVRQMKMTEQAELVVISGAGLEEFMEDILVDKNVLDCSEGISLLEMGSGHHHEEESHDHGHGHHHEHDPHIWLSPVNAAYMAQNICAGLTANYPEYESIFNENLALLKQELEALQAYGESALAALSCRNLITFHDGFGYLADAGDWPKTESLDSFSGEDGGDQRMDAQRIYA